MKRLLSLLLPAALVISLWFNWQNHRVPPLPPVPSAIAPSPVPTAPVLPAKFGEIDFSDTALSDESWQLQQEKNPPLIPRDLPGPDGPSSLPPPPAAPPDWNPEPISLAPEPPK